MSLKYLCVSSVIANDNVELACAFIQKKAVEKVICILVY